MKVLGLVIETQKSRRALIRKMVEEKGYYFDELCKEQELTRKQGKEITRQDKAYKTLKYKWMQKLSLVAKKQKKIEYLKKENDHLKNLNSGAEDAIRSLQADNSDLCQLFGDERAEYKRVIKCLKEMIRVRNIKIAKLKDGIDVPEVIVKKDEKIKELCAKLSNNRNTIYDLKKRLNAAKRYIKLKGLASEEVINKAIS